MPDPLTGQMTEEEKWAQAIRSGAANPGMMSQSAMTPEQRQALQARANYDPATKEAQMAALLRGGQDALMNTGAAQGKQVGDIYVAPTWSEIAANAVKQGVGGYQTRKARQGLDETSAGRRDAEAAKGQIQAADFEVAQQQQEVENTQNQAQIDARNAQAKATLEAAKARDAATQQNREAQLRLARERLDLSAAKQEAAEKRVEAAAKAKAKKRTPQQEAAFVKLQEAAPTRKTNIEKAKQFLTAFESGANSGAGRAILGAAPGVFTEQGQFDELLDSFQEQAARDQLKAAGETRPTDADVERTKQSLFGRARDEETNKILLQNYITDQVSVENQYRKGTGEDPMPMPEITPVDPEDWYNQIYGPQAQQKAQETEVVTIDTQEAFDALPSGAMYIDPDDGKKYRKP